MKIGFKGLATGILMAMIALSLPALAASSHSAADSSALTQTEMDMIKSKIADYGFKGGVDVRPVSQFPGFFSVTVGGGLVFFTDQHARYVIMGHLMDPVARQDLTRLRLAKEHVGVLRSNLDHLVQGGDPTAKDAIVVFTDPDCPFCRRLEQGLYNNASGLKVYYVMTPLTQLHPNAERHAKAILCQPKGKRDALLDQVMVNNADPSPAKGCGNNLFNLNQQLVRKYGVRGTPLIVRLSDGNTWNGYMPAALLKRWAAGGKVTPQQVRDAMQAGL